MLYHRYAPGTGVVTAVTLACVIAAAARCC